MLKFVARRLGLMLLTAFVLTFVVFFLTNLQPNLEKLARTEGSVRMTDEAVAAWIEQNGHGGSVFGRYGQWLGIVPGWTNVDEKGVARGRCFAAGDDPATASKYCGILQGDWGFSTFFKKDVLPSLGEKLGATGWLMLWVMIVMVPTSLLIGVVSGMREGSRTDRVLSTFSIATTA
ncbi:MAG: ABC transporter permease, partial [Tabrizicola sp.]|nr:ABC transporter permease [Tabrizicola sp.]